MTTTESELMAEEWRQAHPYPVEVICDCGEAWMVSFRAGDPIDEQAMVCFECGRQGQPE